MMSFLNNVITITCLWASILGISSHTSKHGITKSGGNVFWHITDIHWDYRYSERGDIENMCHGNSSEESIGYYGHFFCDASWHLIQAALRAMFEIEPNPDFIIWTGDNPPHVFDPKPSLEQILEANKNLTREIQTTFGLKVPIIPIVGNHDVFPKNYFPAFDVQFYDNYLKESGWNEILDLEAQESFTKGAYYSIDAGTGVRIIALNTILYSKYNKIGTGKEDPAGQFEFMRKQFQDARDGGYKVLVAAHIPPGNADNNIVDNHFNATYNTKYLDIVGEFGDVILAHFYGHKHTDQIKIFSTVNGYPNSVGFIAPAITPWFPSRSRNGSSGISPSIRLFTYNHDWLIDYSQYHLNLTKANENYQAGNTESPKWELYYNASDAYGISVLDANTLSYFYKKLVYDDDLFQRYYRHNAAGIFPGYCDQRCKAVRLCVLAYQRAHEVEECLKGNFDIVPTDGAGRLSLHVYMKIFVISIFFYTYF